MLEKSSFRSIVNASDISVELWTAQRQGSTVYTLSGKEIPLNWLDMYSKDINRFMFQNI